MHAADYAVCVLYFVGTVVIGLRSGDQVDTADDYFVAGRSMGSCTVGLSVMAALYSGLTMLGTPGYTYTNGPVTLAAQAAIIVSVPFTVSLLPVFFSARITSAYEYLELRFSRTLRLAGAALFILRITMYLGSALYVPALAIEALVDTPRWVTIVATGGISAAYTVTGGMRAVIWTDILQFFVLTGSLLVVTAVALWRSPHSQGASDGQPNGGTGIGGGGGGGGAGISGTLEISEAAGHLELLDLSLDPTAVHSFWALAVGGIFANMIQTISDQIAVQRVLSARTVENAQSAYWMKFILNPVAVWPTIACGMALFAYYNPSPCAGGRDEHGMCPTSDPVSLGLIATPDQILPYFALTELPPGLPGLVISGVLAATMSTVSSGLSSLVTVAVTDFLLPAGLLDPNDQPELLRASRWLTGACGLVAMVAAMLVSEWGDTIILMDSTMKGVAGGPLLGLFLLGMMSTRATACGATVGTLCSCSLMALISTATALCTPVAGVGTEGNGNACGPALTWLGAVSFFWYPTIGVVTTVVVGWLASMPLPGHEERVGHLVVGWCGGTAGLGLRPVADSGSDSESDAKPGEEERYPMLSLAGDSGGRS